MSTPEGANTKGKKHFILVCIAFTLPILIAKLALEQQWFDYGVTNQGQLLAQPVSLADLSLTSIQPKKSWLLIYKVPVNCLKSCQKTFNTIGNTYVALGKEMPRVVPVALSSAKSNTLLKETETANRWQFYTQTLTQHALLASNQVFIVDPLGNVVMTHQPPVAEELLPDFGKSILADMKKLLKYSRIG